MLSVALSSILLETGHILLLVLVMVRSHSHTHRHSNPYMKKLSKTHITEDGDRTYVIISS